MFLIKDIKSPYYQIIYFVDGKRTKKSTKKKKKAEAEKVFRQFTFEFDGLGRQPETKSIPLLQFADEYISYCRNIRSKSYIERSIIPALKSLHHSLAMYLFTKLAPDRLTSS
jgi:hypothetical protein